MEVARRFQDQKRRVAILKHELSEEEKKYRDIEAEMLDLVEQEKLPSSFKCDGSSIYTRLEIWASPADGDHGRLSRTLAGEGLYEYLPSTVNSQKISAYVREHYDPQTDTFVGLSPDIEAALKITKRTRVVAAGV